MLELVLVLGILAILALVAVRSLTGVEDQARFDASRTELANIEHAVLGSPTDRDLDGAPQVLSFVSDMGRLPRAVGSDPSLQLQELWVNPGNTLPPLALRTSVSDPDVTLATGWRGAYLRLGINQSSLLDGWNNPYDLLRADQVTQVAAGDLIEIVRSRGADGAVDTAPVTGFDADQIMAFNASATGIVPAQNRYTASISGRIYILDPTSGQTKDASTASGEIVVRLFGPDPNATNPPTAADNGLFEQFVSTTTSSSTGSSGLNYTFISTSTVPLTIGQRVLRAYQGATVGDVAGSKTAFAATAFTAKSIPVRLNVTAGAVTRDLILIPISNAATQPATP